MKRIKKFLSVVITAAMAISILVLPASANAIPLSDDSVVFFQDFDSGIYANPDDSYWINAATINDSLDSNTNNFFRIYRASSVPAVGNNGPDGTKALYLNQRKGGSYYYLDNGVYTKWDSNSNTPWTKIEIPYVKNTDSVLTTGYFVTTFDYYPSIGIETFRVSGDKFETDPWTWGGSNSDVAFYNGNDVALARTWYKVNITEDLDNQVVWVSIKNAETDAEAYATHWKYTKGLGMLEILTDHGSNDNDTFSKPENSAIIDNIKIERKTFSGDTEPEYIFTQGFGSANISAFFSTSNPKWRIGGNELPEPPYMRVPLGVDMADPASRDENYSGYKNKAYAYGGETGSRTLMLGTHGEATLAAQMSVGERRTDGKYKLTYKFYPANGTNKVVIDSLQVGTDSGRTDRGVVFSTDSLTRQWYDAEVLVDLDDDTAKLTYYVDGTTTVGYTQIKSYTMDLGVFEFIQDGVDGVVNTVEGSARFEDITLYNVYTTAPSFNKSLIKCFAGDEEQKDLSEIAHTTNKIQITLPQQIKSETMIKSNFKLLDSSDNEVQSTGTYENGVCTLEISGQLEYGESYRLCIKNLENVSGYTMATPYNEIITVAEKDTEILSVTKGGNTVYNAGEFTSGDSITIDYRVKNPTDDTISSDLIIVYYSIDQKGIPELVRCDVLNQNVQPSTEPTDFSKNYVVPQIDREFNRVDIMIWDSVSDMNPYSNIVSFEGKIQPLQIEDGVSIHTPLMSAYLDDAPENCGDYVDGLGVKDKPLPITFNWEWNSSDAAPTEYILKVSENDDLSNAKEFVTDSTTYDVYNLKVGTKYYWNVTGTNGVSNYTSATSSFVTEDKAPRNLLIDGVRNARDIGGWHTSDGRVKQGLVYRSFRMSEDKNDTFVYSITEDGIDTMHDDLGIRTEIDLRQNSEFQFNYSALGNDVNYIKAPMNYERDYMENNKASIKTVFDALADPNTYPVVYHCAAGADRTAVITYLLNGLLGVEKDDLLRDYSITNFSAQGSFRPISGIQAKYVDTLDNYTGATLAEKIYNYLNIEVGVSKANLDFIIDYLSE